MTIQEGLWLAIGGIAQTLFAGRMVVQWWASERRGRSIVPTSFWYMSIGGGAMMLAYALWRRDPVFIVGQSAGLFVYVRNVILGTGNMDPDAAASIPPSPARACDCPCHCSAAAADRAA